MLFNSFEFLVFAPIALLGHALLRGRALRAWLIAASYVFYGWALPWYCLLLLACTAVGFTAGLGIGAARGRGARRAWLAFALAGNLGLLGVFKYAAFAADSFNGLAGWLGLGARAPVPDIVLPIGISFYTFQTLSYVLDVHRGAFAPTRRFSTFALYVAFFPQLVAGPIERAGSLLPQVEARQPCTSDDRIVGITRILWGLLKKVVVADGLAVYVNQVYAQPEQALPGAIALANYAFAFEIYLDFSAYSDIAIGLARCMGIELRENFRWPFLARNIAEFWRRWHISLSTWIRDYLFVPLGGYRHGPARTLANAILVFFLTGLWHGADGRFVVWGFWVGLVYVAHHLWSSRFPAPRGAARSRLREAGAVLLTFHAMWISWFFFRAPSAADAFAMLRTVLTGWSGPWFPPHAGEDVLRASVWIGVAAAAHVLRGGGAFRRLTAVRHPVAVGVFWGLLVAAIGLLHAPIRERFIYFQF